MAGRPTAAVIGTGFIGMVHVEALRRNGVDVVGLLGSSPDRAGPKADSAGIDRVYTDLDELLADRAVDVVHVTSPNHVHAVQATAVLEAGKHLVCEKPLGLHPGETRALRDLAAASGLVNAVCFNLRSYPLCRQMMHMVAAGELGVPRYVTGSYFQDWLLEDTDWNWRLDPEVGGGLRAVADIGSHWLDLAAHITGQRVVAVMADLHTFIPVRRRPTGPVETFAGVGASERGETVDVEVTTEDAASVLLRFEDGAGGTVAISQLAAGSKNSLRLEVDGSEAALRWWSESPDQLWVGHRDRPNEELRRDPSLLTSGAAALSALPAGHVEGYADTFRALFAEVYADVRRGGAEGRPTYPDVAAGHDVLCVTDAIACSAEEERWVTVER